MKNARTFSQTKNYDSRGLNPNLCHVMYLYIGSCQTALLNNRRIPLKLSKSSICRVKIIDRQSYEFASNADILHISRIILKSHIKFIYIADKLHISHIFYIASNPTDNIRVKGNVNNASIVHRIEWRKKREQNSFEEYRKKEKYIIKMKQSPQYCWHKVFLLMFQCICKRLFT